MGNNEWQVFNLHSKPSWQYSWQSRVLSWKTLHQIKSWTAFRFFFYEWLIINNFLTRSDMGQHGASLSLYGGPGPGLAHSLGVQGHGGQPRCQGGHGQWRMVTQRQWSVIQVDSLGHLLSLARHTLVYAGCGLSTSAGVAQTARGHRFVEPRSAAQLSDRSRILRSEKRTEAVPGLAHFTLTSLYKVWLETGLA